MRELVFDTYYGEGRVLSAHENYPKFRHVYHKVAEGANGFIGGANELVSKVTLHNAIQFQEQRERGELDTHAIYIYLRRHDYVSIERQARAFLDQLNLLIQLGIKIDYLVIDLEPYNNAYIHEKYGWWVFHQNWGSWVYTMVQLIKAETDLPVFLYSFTSAIYDMFDRFGYRWHREMPWIIAQYPSYGWDTLLHENVLAGVLEPRLGYVEYLRDQAVMWQYSDKYPVEGWQIDQEGNIGSHAADVNVWLKDWRVVLDLPLPIVKKASDFKRFVRSTMRRLQPR